MSAPNVDDTKVAFIGLGDLGGPMGERIIADGWDLSFFARRPEVVERFATLGGKPVANLHDLGAAGDVVCIMVVDDDGVREVLHGADGILSGMRPGSVLVIHSTVHPDTCRELEAIVNEHGIALVDAPVSGASRRAMERDLTVLVGAAQEDLDRVEPVFRSFASTVQRFGPVGSGQVAKLINNLFAFAHQATATDEARLVREFGLDLEAACDVLPTCSGSSQQFRGFAQRGLVPYEYPKGTLVRIEVIRKDLRHIRDIAQRAGIDLGLTNEFVESYLRDATAGALADAKARASA